MSRSNRELLELAAKAAGIDAAWHWPDGEEDDHAEFLAETEGMWLKGDRSPDNSKYWNPLRDDGDAFRLAVKLCINLRHLRFFTPDRAVQYGLGMEWLEETPCCDDQYAAARRAIVRAAAEIWRRMEPEKPA